MSMMVPHTTQLAEILLLPNYFQADLQNLNNSFEFTLDEQHLHLVNNINIGL